MAIEVKKKKKKKKKKSCEIYNMAGNHCPEPGRTTACCMHGCTHEF